MQSGSQQVIQLLCLGVTKVKACPVPIQSAGKAGQVLLLISAQSLPEIWKTKLMQPCYQCNLKLMDKNVT